MNYRGYKILYVDDEPANLTTFRYCFDEQFEVLTASGAEEALGILARNPVAVLLADQRMPEMSGAELCQIVRERHPDVVRMILTAYADITAAVAAINAGAARVLTVSEDDAAQAMRILFSTTHNVPEPAGALALAGLLAERSLMAGKRVAVIHTGGNADTGLLLQVLAGQTPTV